MRLEGDVNIKNIKTLYAGVKDELVNSGHVEIDMKDVLSIDAAAAQVILSATVKAKEIGKDLHLVNVPASLNKILTLAGLGGEKDQGGTNG